MKKNFVRETLKKVKCNSKAIKNKNNISKKKNYKNKYYDI